MMRTPTEYNWAYRPPGTLERAMAAAKKIEVGPSAFQNVTVELTELR